jgi:hypothetical protein
MIAMGHPDHVWDLQLISFVTRVEHFIAPKLQVIDVCAGLHYALGARTSWQRCF